jgi:hypothetical protein
MQRYTNFTKLHNTIHIFAQLNKIKQHSGKYDTTLNNFYKAIQYFVKQRNFTKQLCRTLQNITTYKTIQSFTNIAITQNSTTLQHNSTKLVKQHWKTQTKTLQTFYKSLATIFYKTSTNLYKQLYKPVQIFTKLSNVFFFTENYTKFNTNSTQLYKTQL